VVRVQAYQAVRCHWKSLLPSDVHPRILSAMARPTIGHLDPAFVGMMNETKEGLKSIFKTV
jgi:aspartate aminotransferase-like enzyme